jgi:hypothetical protein
VGELALFSVIIKNTGDEPVTNLVINDRYDPALEPRSTGAGATRREDDSFEWKIPLLTPGERREFKVSAACVSPANSACSSVTVTADGGIIIDEERCVEILPPAQTGGSGVTPAPALPAQPLKLTLQSTANPARVGVPAALFVFVENVSGIPQRPTMLRVQMPAEAPPVANQMKPAGQLYGALEVRFNNIGDIAPGDRRQFEIPFNPTGARVVTFNALVTVEGLTQPISMESTPIQIEAAAQ